VTQDQVVCARDVLRAVSQVRRLGTNASIQQLEQTEPDLTEFLLEELSAVHQLVLALGGRPRLERRVVRRVESMALVLVTSLRAAQLRLWEDRVAGTALAHLDPTHPDAPEADPRPPAPEGPPGQ
jgi:hypothetical protein